MKFFFTVLVPFLALLLAIVQAAPQVALLGGGTGARGTGPDVSQIAAGANPAMPNPGGTMVGSSLWS
ncbi:hypothetical protein DdX_04203 [Ditylenchus destructor]|uniref:Uncharacterized protein n=1 Tax=Ditylenchus destructor TaxID=166010 RepID=A0AAD4NEH3_9BILA|nr:hypothetical protein DdX_04203 [Ditylenchus destructor]